MPQLIRAVRYRAIFALALLVAAPPAFAQADAPKLDSGDTAWMLVATALVLMMTVPGLVLFYGGMVRNKNVLATVMQCFSVCCLVSVVWMIAAYSLAFAVGAFENLLGINTRRRTVGYVWPARKAITWPCRLACRGYRNR